jgi:hypothetical protein
MADSVEGIAEVNVHEEDVLSCGCCIFQAGDESSDLPGGAVEFPEALLGMTEDVVFFYEFAEGVIDESCPELVDGVGEGNGSVVFEVEMFFGGVTRFLEEDGKTVFPVIWCDPCDPHEAEEVMNGVFDGHGEAGEEFIGDAIWARPFDRAELVENGVEGVHVSDVV